MQDYIHDHQATIEYILQETGYETISVFGISHGSTAFLISMAIEPEWFRERVNVFSAFVPIPVLTHSTNNYFALLTNPQVINTLQSLRMYEVMPRSIMNNIPYDGV